ncbi:MAG: PilZ domain-containing protein [Proteobacteria bacterium]|nr:PilZ domain-containing protein [Pseudomonadota bacterium]
MALRPFRQQSQPEVLPQFAQPKPRDRELQERLRRIAAQKAAEMAAKEVADNKRNSARKKTTLPGVLLFRGMRMQMPCTIADLSGTGARVSFPRTVAAQYGELEHLPDDLILVIRADRVEVDCKVMWRRQGSMGLRFLSPPRQQAR